MSTRTKIIIGVSVVAVVGTVAYFGFIRENGWFNKKIEA